MLVLYALKEAWQNLNTHIARTLSMAFGVGWAIFVLACLLGLGNGFQKGVAQAFGKYGAKTIMIWEGRSAGKPHPIPIEMASNVAASFRVIQQISPIRLASKPVRYQTKKVTAPVLGCEPCYAVLANLPIKEGRFFTPRDAIVPHNSCVMGIRIKEKLFGAASAMGQYIFLGDMALQVVGVLDALDASLYAESDAILLTNRLCNTLFPKRSPYLDAIRLTLVPTAHEAAAEAQIRSYFARHLNFDVKDRQGLGLFSIAQHAHKFDAFFKNIAIFNTMIGIGLLLTGIVGMSNMMLVTIQERRQEMAIRRILGSRSIEIIAMIVLEVVMVTLLAGLIGSIVGFSLIQLLNKWVVPLGKAYYLSAVTCSPSLIFRGLGWITLTSGLAGMVPAIRAIRIKPVEALSSK